MQSSKNFKLATGRNKHSHPSIVKSKVPAYNPEARMIGYIANKPSDKDRHIFQEKISSFDRVLRKGNDNKLSKSGKGSSPMRILNKTERKREVLKIYLENKYIKYDPSIANLSKKHKTPQKLRLPAIKNKYVYANISPIRLKNKPDCATHKKLLASDSSVIFSDKNNLHFMGEFRKQKQELFDSLTKPLGNFKRIDLDSVTPTLEFSVPLEIN